MERKHRIEMMVAVIVTVGAIVVAVISNVDKLRLIGKAGSPVELTPHVPTNDIEVELRHQVEITGLREGLQVMKSRLESKYKERYKLTDDELACIIDTSFFPNDYIDIIVEVQKKHMTLQEVQELNRIFSSEAMTNYRRKQTVILQDFMEEMDRLVEKKYKTLKKLTTSSKTVNGEHSKACPAKSFGKPQGQTPISTPLLSSITNEKMLSEWLSVEWVAED